MAKRKTSTHPFSKLFTRSHSAEGDHKVRNLLLWVIFLGISMVATDVSAVKLYKGLGNMGHLISRMLPPDWQVLPKVGWLAVETIQIAFVATSFSVLLAIPLSFLAAKNITPSRGIYHLMRNVLNFLRGIPELIFALLFVTAVGLGPFAGILALTAHTTGVLGKMFAEYIESSDKGLREAMLSTGANKLQVIVWGILPSIMPQIVAMTFYRFEVNVRSATVLGFVGAGGIGFFLLTNMRLLNYKVALTCILVILLMVAVIDYIGTFVKDDSREVDNFL